MHRKVHLHMADSLFPLPPLPAGNYGPPGGFNFDWGQVEQWHAGRLSCAARAGHIPPPPHKYSPLPTVG